MSEIERPTQRKEMEGIVVSDKMSKTIVVKVEHLKHDLKYGKRLRRSNTFKAHDEKNEAHVGDRVRLAETRRLSKDKFWRLAEVIERAK